MAKSSKKSIPCLYGSAHQSLTEKIARDAAEMEMEREEEARAKRPRATPRDPARRVDPPNVLGDPLHANLFLAEAMGSGVPKAIERSEAQGQRDLVRSSQLPKKMQNPIALFEKIGVVFISRPEAVSNNELFVDVILPTGWKLQPTDHSMWSDLIDAKGRKRASMFYKAAFYDRDAFISLTGRFSWERFAPRPDNQTPAEEAASDQTIYRAIQDRAHGNGIIFSAERRVPVLRSDPTFWSHQRPLEEALDAEMEAWLTSRYPQWKDPTAHWDDP